MNALLRAGLALLAATGPARAARADDAAPFVLRAMPGFTLSGPSYRAAGDGLAVTVRVCRIAGWAAASPPRLHVLREGPDSDQAGHRDLALGRLGLRLGENCERAVVRFPGPPRPQERIRICLAYAHRRCE